MVETVETTRWERIQHVFEEASELPERERESWLASQCGADQTLYRQVRSLLSAYDAEGGALEQAVASYANHLMAPPACIGPYRILSEIGRGGMGAVYLAAPAEGEPRKVALKMVRTEASSDENLTRRFRTECQILGELDHPNVARMLDGGITSDGIRYLVMEYVDGVRIDQYCRERNVPLRERIVLFRKVCAAVQEAHRRLVVHRDIKPSNILVTPQGEPKLLDFGIAKLLRPSDLPYSVAQTRAAERVMTPAYASPEQIRGQTITTASDIYSLGTVLYELLARQRPFESDDPVALGRAVCEDEPRPPSAAADPIFAADLRDDLDQIVLKAIRKEPGSRYGSVQQFSDDLERYLGGYPVIAHRGTRRYHLGKFVRRHRVAVASLGASLALLVAFASIVTFENARVRRERDIAQRERRTAQKISSFLNGLFRGSDPYRNQGTELTARQLLDNGARRVSKELRAEPEVRAEVLETIGEAYKHLDALDGAERVFREKVEAVSQFYGPGSEQTVGALRQLGDTERLRGNLQGAEADLRRALAISEKLPPGQDLEQSHTLNNLAIVEQVNGDLEEAEQHSRRAVAINGKYPAQANETLTMRANLALILTDRGKDAEAESILSDVLEKRRKLVGENNPQVPIFIRHLALVIAKEGRYREAEQLARDAVARYRKLFGPEHPETLQAISVLGVVLGDEGSLQESEALLRQVTTIGSKGGDASRYMSAWWSDLGWTLFQEGRIQEAGQVFERSLALISLRDSIREGRVLVQYGPVEAALGREAEARKNVQTALNLFRSKSGTAPRDIAEALFRLATISPRGPETENQLRQAVEMDRTPAHLLGLADFLVQTGRAPEAEPLAREAMERRSKEFPDLWSIAVAKSVLASALAAQGVAESPAMAAQAVADLDQKPGPRALATQAVRDRAAHRFTTLSRLVY